MYNEDIGLETYNFKKLLDTTCIDIFTVLSFENLEQVLGGGMILMFDERIWT